MVAHRHVGDAAADLDHHASAFVAEDRRKNSLAVEAVKRVGIGVTDACRLYLDKDFARLRAFQIEFGDFEGFFGFERDGGACLHVFLPKHLA